MKNYIINLAVAIDILVNALIPGGKERETISGRLGINYPGSFFALAVNWVFWKLGFWPDPTHCQDVAKEENQIFKDEDIT